jgi:hypothetical protein
MVRKTRKHNKLNQKEQELIPGGDAGKRQGKWRCREPQSGSQYH